MTQTPPNSKAVVRLMLMLSSVTMVVLAGLTFGQVLPLPTFTGYLFLLVATVDVGLGLLVFRG